MRERNLLEQHRHVVDGADGYPDPPDFAGSKRMIRVVADLRREVEGHAETLDSL